MLFALMLLLVNVSVGAQSLTSKIFAGREFTQSDAILVSDAQGQILFEWRAEQAMLPASLVKLLTTMIALEKWQPSYQFKTEFYRLGDQLWVKGYGDPYLTSEELDVIVQALSTIGLDGINSVHIDNSYFTSDITVPGRSEVSDPYNAPVSAVAINFNTATLKKEVDKLLTAEPQTPLTPTAIKLAKSITPLNSQVTSKSVRINLRDKTNAQSHFAELLIAKSALKISDVYLDQNLPNGAQLIYQHKNSKRLQSVLNATLLYSNNFIANQVFLKLAELNNGLPLSFALSESYVSDLLQQKFAWQAATVVDGSGLSRDNRLSANQIDEVLQELYPHQKLLKKYDLNLGAAKKAHAYAKTGTFSDVSNYAGFLHVANQEYRFVFMFNRKVPYGYREQLLKTLASDLLNPQESVVGQR